MSLFLFLFGSMMEYVCHILYKFEKVDDKNIYHNVTQ